MKLNNKRQITDYLNKQSILIERALIYYLEVFVAELVNHAKENQGHSRKPIKGDYVRTGNLVSSIGGAVLKSGRPVTYRGFSGEGEGVSEGKEFINSLVGNYDDGYTILIVAGMEYSTFVENFHNLNVLKKTELKMQTELPDVMRRLKKAIDKAA